MERTNYKGLMHLIFFYYEINANIKFNVVFVSTILLSINFTSLAPLIANTILSYSHFHKTPQSSHQGWRKYILRYLSSILLRATISEQWPVSGHQYYESRGVFTHRETECLLVSRPALVSGEMSKQSARPSNPTP